MRTRISVAPTKNSRARRTSPTDPASSSPGSFYVTALWRSPPSSPTLSTHRTSPNTSDKPQRTQTHTICFLLYMHARTAMSSGVYNPRAGKHMQSIKCVFLLPGMSSHGLTTPEQRMKRCLFESQKTKLSNKVKTNLSYSQSKYSSMWLSAAPHDQKRTSFGLYNGIVYCRNCSNVLRISVFVQ